MLLFYFFAITAKSFIYAIKLLNISPSPKPSPLATLCLARPLAVFGGGRYRLPVSFPRCVSDVYLVKT